jgi:hypothetical protein
MGGSVTEQQLMQADETLSPVDLPGDEEAEGGLRWASSAIAIGALFLLFFNAVTIDDWAQELPPGPATERLTRVTGGWVTVTGAIGLTAPRALVHDRWKRGQALRFGGAPAAASPAPGTSPPSR